MVESFKGQAYVPEEIRKLEDSLGDQYLCNFSVFQSLLDHWALGQLFPIMPVSRLNERPTREATLVDITCDSDGQVNKFIDLRDVRDTLPLHQLNTNGNGQLGALLPRLLPDGRVPGHHGRPAQPLRARQRGAMSSSNPTSRPATTSKRSSRAARSSSAWPRSSTTRTN